jgi:hypothetical protein
MTEQGLARLESQLESLVEGAFAQIFGGALRAHDLSLHLMRAMQEGAVSTEANASAPAVPDEYFVYLAPAERQHILERQPALEAYLADHMRALAEVLGFRLEQPPLVHVRADDVLQRGAVRVTAARRQRPHSATSALEYVPPPSGGLPPDACLMLEDGRTIALHEPLVTLGRSRDNLVVLDDQTISRYHAQLRSRFGVFTLFDSGSQSGTFVNGVRVQEHALQKGDVIRLGRTSMVYMDDSDENATAHFPVGDAPGQPG